MWVRYFWDATDQKLKRASNGSVTPPSLPAPSATIWFSPSPHCRSIIRLKISDNSGDAIPKLKAAGLRQVRSQEQESSNIIGELPCYTSGSAGLAFDSEREVEGKFRVAFIPVTGGFAQITLTTPNEEFRGRQMDLGRLLNSFRVTKLKPA